VSLKSEFAVTDKTTGWAPYPRLSSFAGGTSCRGKVKSREDMMAAETRSTERHPTALKRMTMVRDARFVALLMAVQRTPVA